MFAILFLSLPVSGFVMREADYFEMNTRAYAKYVIIKKLFFYWVTFDCEFL